MSVRYLEGPQPLCRTFVQVRPQRATGAYECSFMPQQAGRVAVLVQLRGEGVGGSPFLANPNLNLNPNPNPNPFPDPNPNPNRGYHRSQAVTLT